MWNAISIIFTSRCGCTFLIWMLSSLALPSFSPFFLVLFLYQSLLRSPPCFPIFFDYFPLPRFLAKFLASNVCLQSFWSKCLPLFQTHWNALIFDLFCISFFVSIFSPDRDPPQFAHSLCFLPLFWPFFTLGMKACSQLAPRTMSPRRTRTTCVEAPAQRFSTFSFFVEMCHLGVRFPPKKLSRFSNFFLNQVSFSGV